MNSTEPNLDRIFTALQEARTKLEAVERDKQEPIAIIGMAGRFPGAENIAQFWENLKLGISGIRDLSDQELIDSDVPPEIWQQPNYVRAYASPDNIDGFDAELFGYSPREAELLDPQHRLFLESAWSALEDAGHDPEQFPGRIAIYGGAAMNGYLINLHSDRHLRETLDPVQVVVSNALGLMPMRVAHKLNLTGIGCGVQTGCSTSLVAVHLACQSLRNRECDMVLAGGASVGILEKQGYLHQSNSILSPDGRCRAFDAMAQGTVFGNGVGVVVLKRLGDAVADGNRIYALVRSTAVNNDGAQKVGLTAPSVSGQAEVIAMALRKAKIEPSSISYIETHGTGTSMGDPIEIAALQKVYSKSDRPYCAIGSVKTNLGHLDAAAGVAGLIKTALMLHHQQIPPSLNFQTLNPEINADRIPFYINTELQNWPTNNRSPRPRAAVSSFGMGGTNAHAILEAVVPDNPKDSLRTHHLIPLSAKTPSALATIAQNLKKHLEHDSQISLADLATTLQLGRKALEQRRTIVCSTIEQLITSLGEEHPVVPVSPLPIAFLFSGQGSQHISMGEQLYQTDPIFRSWLDRGFAHLKNHCNLDLQPVLYSVETTSKSLTQTQYSQPALFLIEYAMAQLLMQWGIKPQAMLGHSIGEYVAAALAGVFSFEVGLEITASRGRFMQSCESGVMLSISQPDHVVQNLLPPDTYLAVVNAPNLCVVSGSSEAIATLEQILDQNQHPHRRLQTSHAFHSPRMQTAADQLLTYLNSIELNPPQQPWISNLTGTWITPKQAIAPQYWVDHLLNPVLFSQGFATLQETPHILIEVGPGQTLCTLAKQNGMAALATSRHPQDSSANDTDILFKAIAQLWNQGITINWQVLHSSEPHQRISLPTYPFEHQSYWIKRQTAEAIPQIRKADLADYFYLPTWQRSPLLTTQIQPDQTWQIYCSNPEQAQQWYSLLAETGAAVSTVDKIENLANPSHLLIVLNPQNTEFTSIVQMVETLTQQSETIAITVITQEVQPVLGNETLNLDQSLLYGIFQVLTQEYSQITCRLIDLDAQMAPTNAIIRELQQPFSDRFSTIAYRHSHRWQPQYPPINIPESRQAIRGDRTYIIAGEMLDSLAPIYAQWISQTPGANLLLLGNTNLPHQGQWETWLATHGPQDPVSQWIQQLQAVQISGTQLQFVPTNLLEPEILSHPTIPIGGIIYTGTMGDRNSHLLKSLTVETLTQQIQSKIQSLLNLEKAFQTENIDFFLVQSSLSSVVGGMGFAAYAAAHHYIDRIAHQRHQSGSTPWFNLNWDAVQFTAPGVSGSPWLENAIALQDIGLLTDRILSQGIMPQVIISPINLAQRQKQSQMIHNHHHDRPTVSASYLAPRNPTEQRVAELMQSLLGISTIGVEDNFFELGGHSLLAIQAVSQLRTEFQVDIPMRQFLFESPNVAGIAQLIETYQLQSKMDEAEDLLNLLETSN
jgi:acyl transferase domain-containing protein/acyl carrier protein